ncbi:MAG: hypothetical protein NT151_02600 [Acidobacteria bacterium]|nr:hypothetical protein [Acidobacteriota bacterium]
MKSRTVRVLMVAIAVVAQAGAGYLAWRLDQQMRAERTTIAAFEAQVRQASESLAAIGAAERGYVAEGQSGERWQTQVTTMMKGATPKLTDLRLAAKTPEAQGALETAIEIMASFGQADAKARDYVSSGQRLSASDVIFADGPGLLTRAIAALEDARVRENVQHEAALAKMQQTQLFYLGGAVGLTLVILLVLVPVPRVTEGSDVGDGVARAPVGAGLGLSQPSSKTAGAKAMAKPATGSAGLTGHDPRETAWSARVQELGAAADICASLARVQNLQELPALLERAAGVLDATGVIIWMSEGSPALLRPVLAHGYAPATLARMGSIGPDADNATATAYRTRTVQTLPADPPSGGALVVPLVTADGCTGAIAVELKKGVEPSDYLRAVTTILAAQLATLITSAPAADALHARE